MIDSFVGNLVVAILGGFVGGIVGGLFALLGVFVTDWLKNRREKEEIKSILKAIYCEVGTFWNIYEEKIGQHIESHVPENESYFLLTSIDWLDNSFPIYDNNSSKISFVKEETYKDIIRFYMYARDIISTLREYQIKFDRLEKADWDYSDTRKTQPGVTSTEVNKTEEMNNIDLLMKNLHNNLDTKAKKEAATQIFRIINKGGPEGKIVHLKFLVADVSQTLGNRHEQFKKVTEQLLKDLKLEFEK